MLKNHFQKQYYVPGVLICCMGPSLRVVTLPGVCSCGSSMGRSLQATSTMGSSTGCRGISAQLLEHLLPTHSFPFTDHAVCRALSLVFFSLLFLISAIQWFSSFLKIYSHRGAITVGDGSALASGGSVLEPAGTGWKQAPGFFS